MYCEVILSQRFPKHLGIFDYKIPAALLSQIKVGQLVTVPFRKSEREGVVINWKKSTLFGNQIKEIVKINRAQPILTPEQINLAKWLSDYYFVSLGTVVKMMLPPLPKKKSAKITRLDITPLTPPFLPQEINELIFKCLRGKCLRSLFWPSNAVQRQQFMFWLLKKVKDTTLIIVPTISDIDDWLKLLSADQQKAVAVLHSQLNNHQFYTVWQNIITQKAKIIIGTKLALFAPLIKPQLIIVDQEENQNHKQADQNPRFDNRTVAVQLAKLHHCRLLYSSHAPTVETFADKTIQLLRPADNKRAPVVVDMRDERQKRNYSLLSDRLQEEIEQALRNHKKVFLFINKRGAASSVVCRDCGHIMKCSQCGLPLAHHTTRHAPRATSFLYCHRCNKKYEMPPFCPRCSSVDFRFQGSGTQKAEHLVRRLWPRSTVARLDKDVDMPQNFFASDMLIGTEFAFYSLNWEKIGLVGVITADTALYLPDFRSTERTWQILLKISFYTDAPMVVQTYNAENKLFQDLSNNKIEQLYDRELNERRTLGYPPFTALVKLIHQHIDKKKCLENAQKLLRYLKTSSLKPLLLVPLTPYLHRKWRMYIIIKFNSPSQDLTLRKILANIPEGWIIDRDPVNLL